MKLFKTCFWTVNKDGSRVSHGPVVAIRKIHGKDAYKIKWDFSECFQNSTEKAKTITAGSYKEAISKFTEKELFFSKIEFESIREITLE